MTAIRWGAVHTKPMQELTAQKELENQDFEVFLPLFWKTKSHGGRKERVKRALVDGYVFARIDDPDSTPWRSINGTRGCIGLVCQGDRPALIRDAELDPLRALIGLDGMAETKKISRYYDGQKLQISGGPLAGNAGLFVVDEEGRITLSVDLLGRKVRVTVNEDQVAT